MPPHPPSAPPPLRPPQSKQWLWVLLSLAVLLMVLGIGVAITIGFTMTGRRVQAERAARKAGLNEIEKTAADERQRMATMLANGEIQGGGAAVGRMKEQFEKSAAQFGAADAKAARALAAFMGKLQIDISEYEAVAGRLAEVEVFRPKQHDRALLASHRQLVRDFLDKNARLTDTLRRGEELVRAELDAARVPARIRDATLDGFNRSQLSHRPIQLRIRGYDQQLGETVLATLDLLEKHWTAWKPDPSTGQLIFEEDAALASYNALMEKVQALAAEQSKAQKELGAKIRAAQPR